MRNLLTIIVAMGLFCQTQAADLFTPVRKTELRAPSVPLITSDPYLSIWSPYDKLNEGATQHWTGAEHPLLGAVRVDGKIYRFMGKQSLEALLPMADDEAWKGTYTFQQPTGNWTAIDYDANSWKTGKAAFGSSNRTLIGTQWNSQPDIWIRREFNLNENLDNTPIYLKYSHDDVFELYLNGERLVSTDYSWKDNVILELTGLAKKKLQKGKNVISAHCHNTTGGAYVDFGLFVPNNKTAAFENMAVQKSVSVLPTQTYYTFACGSVELKVVFTAPLLLDDLDLISTPINYISYQIHATDNKQHNVQVYIETTPQLAINDMNQATLSKIIRHNGLNYIQAGTIEQPITARKGDLIGIDWGYAYLSSNVSATTSVSLGDYNDMKSSFASTGKLLPSQAEMITRNANQMPSMAYMDNLGEVSAEGKSGFIMIGYDDIYSIEYMFQRRMAYWKHDGKISIFDAFERAKDNYNKVMERCRAYDAMIFDDAEQAGGHKYAEICAVAYRQVIAAHKLFKDDKNNLLFFSKENNSNGCINTVDLTYPSAPLFLVYNPELQKAMMTSIFEYSASGRWNKPFPAHDLGTYPIANGQVYGGDMPIEEGGNMVILTAAIAKAEGNANYAKQYWDLLTIWTDYLVEYGQDPENQLCTDDFAGHWAHNANLSVKAIMGIAAYSELANMLGMKTIADKYATIAKNMAKKWEEMAREGNHYRLAFDRENTWSQKYNMVWDKMWGLNLFPGIPETEIKYYLTKQNIYGLPLDNRQTYTKSDWIMWTATLSSDQDTFEKFICPIYKYINETTSRVPLSDWHYTDTGSWVGFKARSVIGGYWMQVLMEKMGVSFKGQSPIEEKATDLNVFSPQTGNPVIPAYLADASIVYDELTKTFYAYGTNDGAGGGNVFPTQMWYSKDCKNWINRPLSLPKSWTDYAGAVALWAPSMLYNPSTKKYYLMYGIDCKTFVAMSDTPLGPWKDANAIAPGKMLYKGYDGQFFLDDDQTMYIVTDNGFFKIMKLAFDAEGKISIDNNDTRFTESDSNEFIGTYKYKSVKGIRNMFEASFLYKRNGLYYLMWSFEGSENYNVRYAVSKEITGPYQELNHSMENPILVRDNQKQILGPGHHSMFDYKGRTFIAYHRQHYPFVDSKRQTCIDEVFFASDGSILPITPTHKGVEVVKGAKRYKGHNLALGKPTKVSSARAYDASPFKLRYRTHNIEFQYTGNYAVDDNYGTHWDPGLEVANPWIIIDLEKECRVKEVETIFEFTNRTYKYKIEYLPAKDCPALDKACENNKWQLLADRSIEGASQSPIRDTPEKSSSVKARFIRLTILNADVPPTADGLDEINARNGWSIFEIRVFGN